MPNTIDVLGDDATLKLLIERTITEFEDNELKEIGSYALYGCSELTSLSLPNVVKFGSYAVGYCSKLLNTDFSSAEEIGEWCFNQTNLPVYFLPKVKKLGGYCFAGSKTTEYIIGVDNDSVCVAGESLFFGVSSAYSIYVPDNLVDAYKSATNWSAYASKIKPYSEYTGA